MPCAHGFQQLKTGDPRRARAVKDDLHILDLLVRQVQRVDQACCTDHGRAVLVVMKDGNVHLFLEGLLDDEAFRRLDIFKIDAAEAGPHQAHRLDELVRVLGIQLDVDGIHIGEPLEQNSLAFHHRL